MSIEKQNLHPRNKHRQGYPFEELVKGTPELLPFLKLNPSGATTIDFSSQDAVILLNKALLKHYYGIDSWDIPAGYLCPPVPGRADYIHYLADLLSISNMGKIPKGMAVTGMDIGVGANCIYPLIGYKVYGWNFIGSDIDTVSVESAKEIVSKNGLNSGIEIRQQQNQGHFLEGVIRPGELIDFTICNPPFHSSPEEAKLAINRKWGNLKGKKSNRKNFGGIASELWVEGGEEAFIRNMVFESKEYTKQVFWFTCLVSKAASLPAIQRALKAVNPTSTKTIEMSQGQKSSRFVAWTFLKPILQKDWMYARWK
jgi:23S rRNA (adenine1618-N6)-methyltransferase